MNDSPEPSGPSRMRPQTIVALIVAALVPAIPIIAAVVMTSGNAAATNTTSQYQPYAASTTTTTTTTTTPSDNLPAGTGALVALVLHKTTMRVAPGGRAFARIGTKTGFGSPQALWVVQHVPRWLGVISTDAGNGRIGWIPRSAVSLGRVRWELRVSLSARSLSVIDSGKLVRRFTVAIGRPSAPTPTGRFAVTDRLQTGDPTGPYGCCILALSAHSPHAISGWNGGDRIAIHSTPDTSSIGQPVSHGCVRLTLAEGRWLLSHIPLGTPTIIST